MTDEERVVNCRFCCGLTKMTGTRLCDNCYEVWSRVRLMPWSILVRIMYAKENDR